MRWLAIACLLACKSRGTITVEFARGDLACTDGSEAVVLYAQPNVDCERCDCGACFGAGGVDACDGTCEGAGAVELDLDPGHWAVIYMLVDAETGVERAQGCAAFDVDADGTATRTAGGTLACVTCE